MGLTGPSGVLPRIYTEQLIARQVQQRDRSAQDFFDLFNHRLVALFWLAWAKHRPEIGRQFASTTRCCATSKFLVGMGTPALQARGCTQGKGRGGQTATERGDDLFRRPDRATPARRTRDRAGGLGGGRRTGTGNRMPRHLAPIAGDARTGWDARTMRWARLRARPALLGSADHAAPDHGLVDRDRFNSLLPRGARLGDTVELSRFP